MTRLPQKEEGQDLTEYAALLVALIAIVVRRSRHHLRTSR